MAGEFGTASMNDRYDSDEVSPDVDAFLDWVKQTAENEDTSPDTVIQQLMSTYWILKELTETIEETPYKQPVEKDAVEGAADSSQDDGPESTQAMGDVVDVIKAISEFNRTEVPDPEPAGGTIDPRLVDIIEAIQRQAPPPGSADQGSVHVVSQLERLREQISSLARDVEEVDGRIDDVREDVGDEVERVAARVESVKATTDDLETRLTSVDERIEVELPSLEATVHDLETALDRKVDKEAVDGLDTTIDREFDAIEEAFERLLGSLDDTETELESAIESNAQDIGQVYEYIEEQRRLAELKREAMRQGAEKAVCENCSQTITFGLLGSPYCPNCDRTLSSIESGGWNPFRSARVTTEPIRSVATSDASSTST